MRSFRTTILVLLTLALMANAWAGYHDGGGPGEAGDHAGHCQPAEPAGGAASCCDGDDDICDCPVMTGYLPEMAPNARMAALSGHPAPGTDERFISHLSPPESPPPMS